MQVTVNSSTSSSENSWRKFIKVFTITFAVITVAGYLFILLVDPYDSLPVSFAFNRGPLSSDQRFFNPGLARRHRFDSAVIGTSTLKLLNPEELNPIFHSAFVNLSMNAASIFEQEAIFNVFVTAHPKPKVVIFGIDDVYYRKENYAQHIGGVKPEHFPDWMYDENPLNDWLPYNWRTLKHAFGQFYRITGLKNYSFRTDGYQDFTPGKEAYDIDRARKNIYGSTTPVKKQPVASPIVLSAELLKSFEFPALPHLERMLGRLPDETLKIVMAAPFHVYYQEAPGTLGAAKWDELKRRAAELVCRHANAVFLDFMIDSPITDRDENYLDGVHYTVQTATVLSAAIGRGVFSPDPDPYFIRRCSTVAAVVRTSTAALPKESQLPVGARRGRKNN
jgi:hypothetical protein